MTTTPFKMDLMDDCIKTIYQPQQNTHDDQNFYHLKQRHNV